jgi:2-C-methyl-D-erythritol 2,4-cyclodiphosphate synthase
MVGFGYDVHRLAEGESLILGGVQIDSAFGTVAHSDGDVLVHAVIDALLGAAGLSDIGELFPDTDAKYKGADSMKLLEEVVRAIRGEYFEIVNIDVQVVLEKPKLSSHKSQMRANIAKVCNLPERRVNVKATTHEKLGPFGQGEGMAAFAVAELKL